LLRYMRILVMHIKQLVVRGFGVLRLHSKLLSVIIKYFFCFFVCVRLLHQQYDQLAGNHQEYDM
jgi:hypothetical protein